jgi:hypothetical protein
MPRDSGRRAANLHRPKRYNRQLQRVFYTSAVISIQRSPASEDYYDRKRAQGKRTRPSRPVARETTRQRPLGTHPRPPALQRNPTLQSSDRSLTNAFRITCSA